MDRSKNHPTMFQSCPSTPGRKCWFKEVDRTTLCKHGYLSWCIAFSLVLQASENVFVVDVLAYMMYSSIQKYSCLSIKKNLPLETINAIYNNSTLLPLLIKFNGLYLLCSLKKLQKTFQQFFKTVLQNIGNILMCFTFNELLNVSLLRL